MTLTTADRALMREYLAAKDAWELLVIKFAAASAKDEPALGAQCREAENRVDAMKLAAGRFGLDGPLCCQRYGLLHDPAFSVTGCRWYELRGKS